MSESLYNDIMASPDVLIVGGGIIGLTTALELADAGLRVSVLDKGDMGREASWAGAGILPPWGPGRKATPQDELRAWSVSRFADYCANIQDATGIDPGYRKDYGHEIVTHHHKERYAIWDAEGIDYFNVEEPHETSGGIISVFKDYAQVRNPRILKALIQQCQNRKIQLLANHDAVSFIINENHIDGVLLRNGESYATRAVVLCSGAWTEKLLSRIGFEIGFHPVHGQIILLHEHGDRRATLSKSALGLRKCLHEDSTDWMNSSHRQPRDSFRLTVLNNQYVVPRGDGIFLVGSTEEPEAGFEKTITVEAVDTLLRFVNSLSSHFQYTHDDIIAKWSGLRPATHDGLPVIDRVPGYNNLYGAAGHFRSGIQQSLATAAAVRSLILGTPPPVPLTAFRFPPRPHVNQRPAFHS
jgi:glycine oxidase